jgi:2-hydroxy-3-keto-5-methylthiopentenyl-1-phosphate phosphatase
MPDNRSDHSVLIVSDFDGTISRQDIGNRLFHHFSGGRSDEPVKRWAHDEIDSRECLLAEAALMRPVTRSELDAYLETHDIDPDFPLLAALCRKNDYSLAIVSDGLDLYIDPILARHGLGHLPVYSNRARLEDGRLRLEFPYHDDSCGRCANCKGSRIRSLRSPGQTVVYIGDGKSDLCAVDEADIVFAKKYLARYLRERKLPFVEYASFADVTDSLNNGIGELSTRTFNRQDEQ